jgi:ParB family chromosome partitioning protein
MTDASKQAAEAIASAQESAKAAPARKEAAGIAKRSSAFFLDPHAITRKDGFNPRFDFGDIEGLAASIKANGMLNPIRVKRIAATPEGKLFELVDGDRRLTAIEKLLKAGHEFPEGVPAIIVDKAQDEVTSLIQMFVANDGKPFMPLEEAMAYSKMKEAGMTIKQICAAVGRKSMHVTEILNLMAADDSVKAAVADGSIGKTMAKQIATHAKGDASKQAELVQQAKAGAGRGQKADIKKALDTERRAKAAKKGKTLKMRALSDAELSELGKTLAEAMAKCLTDAKKPLDFDVRKWVQEDDKLALAATFGALEALKAAAGLKIDLKF